MGWKEVDGDNTLAIDWPIDEDSIVFEIGGYEGRWSLQMLEKYNPRMYIFEPQPWACDRIKTKLEGYEYNLYNFALWTHKDKLPLGDFGRDGASLMKPSHRDTEIVDTIDIIEFIEEHLPDEEIDVCLMNIEGGEFILLPYMIANGLMKRIKYFWMQLHWFVPDSKEKYNDMSEQLDKTHRVIWDYRPTAICWERKDL